MKVTRTSRRKKTTISPATTSTEELYLVTSLTAWARGHWSIEAVHHIRDRTMDEDRHTARTKNAAQNWAIVRDTGPQRATPRRPDQHQEGPLSHRRRTRPRTPNHRTDQPKHTQQTTLAASWVPPQLDGPFGPENFRWNGSGSCLTPILALE